MSQENVLWSESTPFWVFIGAMLIVILLFALLFILQLIYGPVGTKPPPNWFFAIFIAIFSALTLAFWKYEVVLSAEGIKVGFPAYKVKIPWCKVRAASKVPSISPYAGFGIRLIKYNGEWVKTFNMPKMEKIMLVVSGKKYKKLIISVRDSSTALEYIYMKKEELEK